LKSAGGVRRIANCKFKPSDVHTKSKVWGGLPTKNQAGPPHITLRDKSLGTHLLNKIHGKIDSTVRLLRDMERIIMKLFSNVEVASCHSSLQAPNVGGGSRKEETGSEDEWVKSVLSKIPNHADVIFAFFDWKARDYSPYWTRDNVTPNNELAKLVVILFNDPGLFNRNSWEMPAKRWLCNTVALCPITGL
jgi:hypothetical protein